MTPRGQGALSRRAFVRLLGGAAGVGAVPLNFGCRWTDPYIRNSDFVPTPEQPLTPTARFYVNANYGMPDVPQVNRWRLRVDGLVDDPLALSLDDVLAMDAVTEEVTLECIGNSPGGGLISSAAFTGVPLRAVLDRAGLRGSARGLYFLGLDGYPSYVPVDAVGLLVHTMNGEPLPPWHGAPLRVLLPGRYGMFSIKWLDSITAARTYHTWGVYRGITTVVDGTTAVRSRIDGAGASPVVGEPTEITGLAVTSGTGIARVEVRTEDAWEPADLTFNRLDDGRSPYLWSLWRLRWTPRRAGEHLVSVRAVDAEGRVQDEDPDFPYDSGAIHVLRVRVRE